MDYSRHYELLIERAKNRVLVGYKERHHIVPRCLGGSNKKENLVDLTPEEHYVAHQLLVKLNPGHHGLAHAAQMMTVSSKNNSRNNKRYGWLRRKNSIAAKQRVGKRNGSFGKKWFHDPNTGINIKCDENVCPEGFVPGRFFEKLTKTVLCKSCSSVIVSPTVRQKMCSLCKKQQNARLSKIRTSQFNSSIYYTDGVRDIRINPEGGIPPGFRKGRSKGLRKKIAH